MARGANKVKYVPQVGEIIPVSLPNEIVRATVHKIVSPDSLIVRLDVTPPLAKSHHYKHNDYVAVMREPGELYGEEWRSKSEEQISLERALRVAGG
ncbi:MAG: hypothetical protein KGL39_03615 [Patescibacteria group bacterium]|nr:hypothetical protein [Patescibacteria group bacterium]